MPVLTIRSEVLEYGSVPIASWLPRLDSSTALQSLAYQLGQVAQRDESGRCKISTVDAAAPDISSFALIRCWCADMVELTTLARLMEVPLQHAGVRPVPTPWLGGRGWGWVYKCDRRRTHHDGKNAFIAAL